MPHAVETGLVKLAFDQIPEVAKLLCSFVTAEVIASILPPLDINDVSVLQVFADALIAHVDDPSRRGRRFLRTVETRFARGSDYRTAIALVYHGLRPQQSGLPCNSHDLAVRINRLCKKLRLYPDLVRKLYLLSIHIREEHAAASLG